MRLLVVEDDRSLADVLRRGLVEQGHVVDCAYDGDDGFACANDAGYDLLIFDVNLPRRDGLSAVRDLRAGNILTPILLLTSRDTIEDVVAGLDAGADDYLRKPFAFEELDARLRTLARRMQRAPELGDLVVGALRLDQAVRRVSYNGATIVLTARELAFMEYFMRNAGRTLERTTIEDALFERDSEVMSNVVDVYVRRLRAKLADVDAARLLQTVRGIGYRLERE
ncbi:MAG: response regulator transcription factor [Vulcanimicrobiaceae bacterium]